MDGLKVTKLERVAEGWWRARASLNGTTVPVDTSCGTWMVARRERGEHVPARVVLKRGEVVREVLPAVAAELESRLPRAERGKR